MIRASQWIAAPVPITAGRRLGEEQRHLADLRPDAERLPRWPPRASGSSARRRRRSWPAAGSAPAVGRIRAGGRPRRSAGDSARSADSMASRAWARPAAPERMKPVIDIRAPSSPARAERSKTRSPASTAPEARCPPRPSERDQAHQARTAAAVGTGSQAPDPGRRIDAARRAQLARRAATPHEWPHRRAGPRRANSRWPCGPASQVVVPAGSTSTTSASEPTVSAPFGGPQTQDAWRASLPTPGPVASIPGGRRWRHRSAAGGDARCPGRPLGTFRKSVPGGALLRQVDSSCGRSKPCR